MSATPAGYSWAPANLLYKDDNTGPYVLDSSGTPVLLNSATPAAGEDLSADLQRVSDSGDPAYISTATTTLARAGRCVLKKLVVTETVASTITVYDSLAASGTIVAVLKASIAEGSYDFDINLSIGCTIVTAGAGKVTAVLGR